MDKAADVGWRPDFAALNASTERRLESRARVHRNRAPEPDQLALVLRADTQV